MLAAGICQALNLRQMRHVRYRNQEDEHVGRAQQRDESGIGPENMPLCLRRTPIDIGGTMPTTTV
jgi:hypothetical protein